MNHEPKQVLLTPVNKRHYSHYFVVTGVPSVPFAHIYHPDAGLVEEMKISKPHFREFKDCLNSYAVGNCELPYDDNASGTSDSPIESMGDFQ